MNHRLVRPPPRLALLPYTTLFRSTRAGDRARAHGASGTRGPLRAAVALRHEPLVRASRGRTEARVAAGRVDALEDRKSTRLNSSHLVISYAVFCLNKKKKKRKSTD